MSFVGQSLHPSVITGGLRIITEQLEIRSVNKKKINFLTLIHTRCIGGIRGFVHFNILVCGANLPPSAIVLYTVLCIWSFSICVFPPSALIHFLTLRSLILLLISEFICFLMNGKFSGFIFALRFYFFSLFIKCYTITEKIWNFIKI